MVYLDSNVFIYVVIHEPEESSKAKRAASFLKDVERGKVKG
ncbi:MAG: hypothetical protein QXW32_08005 [Nitrososphaerales archaeon]